MNLDCGFNRQAGVDADRNSSLCLPENAIQAFGNGSDVKTGQPGTSTPASHPQSPQLSTSTAGAMAEPEQNTLRAQIPAQVRGHGDEAAGLQVV